MTTIVSQRSFSKFYLPIIFGVLFCLVMALMVGVLYNQARGIVGEIMMLLMIFGLLCFAVFIVIRYYKNAPQIQIDNESISLNHSKKYFWKDLESIEMTGKRSFKFMGERKEGVLLKFKGENEQYIFDDMYSNSSQIKIFIQQVIVEKVPFEEFQITKIKSEDLASGNVIYYKGSQLLCIEGIVLWLFDLFFLYAAVINVIKYSNYDVFWLLVFMVFFYSIFSRRMYHFGLSGNQLIIRNKNFFWYKTIYYLCDIKEIIFEQRHNMPVTLRVINNDFTSENYPAATISDKKWLMLKKDLEAKGIKVRNECVSEEQKEPVRFKFFND